MLVDVAVWLRVRQHSCHLLSIYFYIACEGAGPGYSTGTILRLVVPPVSASNFACDTMLLLPDGSVLVHDAYGANWLRLTPDI